MSTTITSSEELNELSQNLRKVGNTVLIKGSLSQAVSKTYNAYHSLRKLQITCSAAGGGAYMGILFGPVGWAFTGAAFFTLAGSLKQMSEAEKQYKTLPYADEVRRFYEAKFRVSRNSGEEIVLEK